MPTTTTMTNHNKKSFRGRLGHRGPRPFSARSPSPVRSRSSSSSVHCSETIWECPCNFNRRGDRILVSFARLHCHHGPSEARLFQRLPELDSGTVSAGTLQELLSLMLDVPSVNVSAPRRVGNSKYVSDVELAPGVRVHFQGLTKDSSVRGALLHGILAAMEPQTPLPPASVASVNEFQFPPPPCRPPPDFSHFHNADDSDELYTKHRIIDLYLHELSELREYSLHPETLSDCPDDASASRSLALLGVAQPFVLYNRDERRDLWHARAVTKHVVAYGHGTDVGLARQASLLHLLVLIIRGLEPCPVWADIKRGGKKYAQIKTLETTLAQISTQRKERAATMVSRISEPAHDDRHYRGRTASRSHSRNISPPTVRPYVQRTRDGHFNRERQPYRPTPHHHRINHRVDSLIGDRISDPCGPGSSNRIDEPASSKCIAPSTVEEVDDWALDETDLSSTAHVSSSNTVACAPDNVPSIVPDSAVAPFEHLQLSDLSGGSPSSCKPPELANSGPPSPAVCDLNSGPFPNGVPGTASDIPEDNHVIEPLTRISTLEKMVTLQHGMLGHLQAMLTQQQATINVLIEREHLRVAAISAMGGTVSTAIPPLLLNYPTGASSQAGLGILKAHDSAISCPSESMRVCDGSADGCLKPAHS